MAMTPEKRAVNDITGKGKVAVRITNARNLLLLSDEGYKDTEIAERVVWVWQLRNDAVIAILESHSAGDRW